MKKTVESKIVPRIAQGPVIKVQGKDFNENHDEKGQFSSGGTSSSGGAKTTVYNNDRTKHSVIVRQYEHQGQKITETEHVNHRGGSSGAKEHASEKDAAKYLKSKFGIEHKF